MIFDLKRLILFLIGFLFSLTFIFSACFNQPGEFQVKSGNTIVGDFQLGTSAFVKSDLNLNSVSIVAIFNDTQASCFTNKTDVKMKLTSLGSSIEADSFEEIQVGENFISRFSFEFSGNVILSNFFQTQYSVFGQSFQNAVTLFPDNNEPSLDVDVDFSTVIKAGENISIDYQVSDSESRLKNVLVAGNLIELNSTDFYSGTYEFTTDRSRVIVFEVMDNVGLVTREEVEIKVDSVSPFISDFRIYNTSFDGFSRFLSFRVLIEDDSFVDDLFNLKNFISVDLSDFILDGSDEEKPSYCIFIGDSKYECHWENVLILTPESTDFEFKFNVVDKLGNKGERSFIKEIFVDMESPIVEDFYLVNSLGNKNIFSSYANDSVVLYLKYYDSSSITFNPLFDLTSLPILNQGKCSSTCYFWNISDNIGLFQRDLRSNVDFSVEIQDEFRQKTLASATFDLDNIRPKVLEVSYLELSDIKDSALKSGEEVKFEILIEDENFRFGEAFANFRRISSDSSLNNEEGDCRNVAESQYLCSFDSISLGTGYFNHTVEFKVIDDAGNIEVYMHDVVVLGAREGDVSMAYSIDNLRLVAPLNRNLITEPGTSAIAWFKGNVSKFNEPEYDEFVLVNYKVKSCTNSFIGGLVETRTPPTLYPQEVVVGKEGEFTLRTELGDHVNPSELNNLSLQCTMSILYRDSEDIFEPGLNINFTLDFEFYDMPQGRENNLRASASDLKEKIDHIEGELFTKITKYYDTYQIFDDICTVITNVDAIVGTMTIAKDILTETLKLLGVTYPVGKAIDDALTPVSGWMSYLGFGEDGIVTKMCGYVTCNLQEGVLVESFVGPGQEFIASIVGGGFCSN